jgi:putative DNA primase/helicase
MINFDRLKEDLLFGASSHLPSWLPGGRVANGEYVCATIHGGQGQSFRVNLKTGQWCEFNTGDGDYKGGDLISLYAAIQNIEQIESAKYLAEKYCPSAIFQPKVHHSDTKPNLFHPEYGNPTGSWVYLSKDSKPVLYVARYDPKGQKKQFKPWRFNGKNWECKNIEKNRPLYHLPDVIKNQNVVICEGEKAADACQKIFGNDYIATTWPGGAQAISMADFSVLKGKDVIIWPDADKAGIEAGEKLIKLLMPICKSIKIVEISGFKQKYDAYDFLQDSKLMADLKIKEPDNKQEIVAEIAESYNKSELWKNLKLDLADNDRPYSNADNVARILAQMPALKGKIWFDEFHNKILNTWQCKEPEEWSDLKTVDMMIFIQRIVGISKLGKESVFDAITHYSNTDVRNEPQDWIKSLKWDGIDRIEMFFKNCAGSPESDYSKAVSKNFWISMAARIFDPGCQVDNMVILEGKQGTLKSSLFNKIGGKFYAEAAPDVRSVEFYKCLEAKIIVEFAELSSFSKAEINIIKKMITCRSDRYRASYHRFASDHPRTCILTGSTNDEAYLNDPTGARRFWPLETTKIDIPYIVDNRDQLFAEAFSKYKNAESWWETPEESTKTEQESRRVHDEWENIVGEYIKKYDFITIRDVADKLLLGNGDLDKSTQMRIANVIRLSGLFKKGLGTNANKETVRGWRKITELEVKVEDNHLDHNLSFAE